MGKLVDLTGQKFGRLVVLRREGSDKNKSATWLCECQCPNKTLVVVTTNHLKSGHTKSCGCMQRERVKEIGKNNKKHGLYGSKLYNTWRCMKARTTNPNDRCYKDYGGRGIRVCDEWYNSFETFMTWALSNGYKEGLTIERIDVNGNYCPENCTWITNQEQQNNKRNNIKITYNGKTQSLAKWAKETGINYSTLLGRVRKNHWSVEKILTTPVRGRKNE